MPLGPELSIKHSWSPLLTTWPPSPCCSLRLSGLVLRAGGSVASWACWEKLFSLIEEEGFLLGGMHEDQKQI